MPRRSHLAANILLVSLAALYSQESAAWRDPSPHNVQFVNVEKDVRLEVLDWGGSGSPVVLLAGGGDTAHVFDDFAPKLTANYHVYGITRRGFGASGFAASKHPADRLGEDVRAVIDALKLDKPVLAGHSIAGDELSYVGTRHADRVAGLVYLDAMYPYAFDNGKVPTMKEYMDLNGPEPPPPGGPDLASFRALQNYDLRVLGFAFPEGELRQEWNSTPDGRVGTQRDFPGGKMLYAIVSGGMNKYTDIPLPALVIYANPHGLGTWVDENMDPKVREAAKAYSAGLAILVNKQMNAFESAVPSARVVNLAGAHHYIYLSKEADVLREMRAFLSGLH